MTHNSRRSILVVALMAGLHYRSASARAAETGPSFDCAAARTIVEKAVCADPALAEADRKMADLYAKDLDRMPENRKGSFAQEQKDWINQCESELEQRFRNFNAQYERRIANFLLRKYVERKAYLEGFSSKVARSLCQERGLCDVVTEHDAGIDAAGDSLRVIHLCGPKHCELEEQYSDALQQCHQLECGNSKNQEYWLVVQNKSDLVSKQLLMTGYLVPPGSDPGIAETLSFGDNKITYHRHAGAMCHSNSSITLQLSPLHIIQQSGATSGGCDASESSWNWETFSGEESIPSYAAPPDGFASTPIPMVRMPSEFAETGWKNAQLGTCALTLENGGAGFVIYGSSTAADHPRLKMILVSPKILIVQIRDEKLISGSRNWLHDDRLELWLGRPQLVKTGEPNYNSPHISSAGALSYDNNEEVEPKLYQWGVRISDGKVFPAYGNPPWPLKVDRVEWKNSPEGQVVLKITFPFEVGQITVSYSDGNDGKKVEEIISSSQLRFGNASTLGGVKDISSNQGICTVQEGRLIFVPKQFKSDEPAIVRSWPM